MILHNELKDAILLIFANKADMPNAREADELADMYGLQEVQGHEWNIMPCCALTGDGLGEGLDWLADRLAAKMKKKKSADPRGLHVTKMPENEDRANLTDLTIRTS